MWALVLTLGWILAAIVFGHLRKKTAVHHERVLFLERFPKWARQAELRIMYAVWFVLMLATSAPFRLLHDQIAESARGPGLESVIVTTVGCAVASIVPGLWLANGIFWLVPALREANRQASQDLPAMTVGAANRQLLMMGVVTIPLGIAQAWFGAVAPWE